MCYNFQKDFRHSCLRHSPLHQCCLNFRITFTFKEEWGSDQKLFLYFFFFYFSIDGCFWRNMRFRECLKNCASGCSEIWGHYRGCGSDGLIFNRSLSFICPKEFYLSSTLLVTCVKEFIYLASCPLQLTIKEWRTFVSKLQKARGPNG